MKWFALVFVLLLAGCAAPDGAMEHVMDAGAPEEYRVAFTTAPAEPSPGQEATLRILVTHADGSPVDFEIMHARLIHVMLIRDDLQHFAHIHAEGGGIIDREAGAFTLRHIFPAPGMYRVMVEFSEDGKVVAVPKDVLVAGDPVPVPFGNDVSREKTVSGYTVRLSGPETLTPGMMHMLAFDVSKEGAPVTDLDLFLGEKMHLAVWQEGLRHFEHAHPKIMDGQIMFHVIFLTPGRYKLYPQFQHRGKVITAEFLIKAG